MAIRKSADQRKTEVLAATLRLADELGPDRLTTQAVADAVGLTQPGIFRHFPTKQALWLAVAEDIAEKMTSAWYEALASAETPMNRIERLILAQLRQIEANPAIPAILFSRELHTENEQLRRSFLGLLSNFHKTIARELGNARDAGVLRADVDPEDGAVLLTSLVQGLAIRWSLGARGFSMEREGARLLAAQIRLFHPDLNKENSI